MFICICNNVKESDIHSAVQEGVCSFKELQKQLGVSTSCGECKMHARKCMREASSANNGNSMVAPLLPAAQLTSSSAA